MVKKKKVKKISLKKKLKKAKEPKGVLFKVKPLEGIKKIKIKKPSKPVKVLIKKAKQKPPRLVKPIESPVYPVRGHGVLAKTQRKQTSNGVYKTRIKVLSIGGGGSSIVSEIAPNVKRAGFIAADTNLQALDETIKEVKHFQVGKNLTQGLGTGMNPELGKQAAENDKEKIKEILKGADFCVLVSCLGGGTGSGAAPVFAKILKNLGILTLGIFTLPFEFEGGKRIQIAKDSLEKLRPNLNALLIIPNQKIFQIIDKNTPLKEAFSTINKALVESLEGLITLIYSPGLINVNFADLKTILAGRGRLAYLTTVEVEGLNQIEELAKRVLSNPLLPYSAQKAKEILFNIDGGLNLSMSQVEQIGKTISESINPQARIAFGITQNKKEGIKITLLANGCKWEEWEQDKKRSKKESKKKQTLITKIREKPKEKAKKKKEKKPLELPKIQQPEVPQIPTEEKPEKVKIQVRKNALEMKESIEKEEKRMIAQERKWETPAFLRHSSSQTDEEVE